MHIHNDLHYCQVSLKINQNLIPGDELVYRGAVFDIVYK